MDASARVIKLYRYILTGEVPGKYWTKCICTAPAGEFKWLKYKLFSWQRNSELSCTWRLDGRSVRYIEGIEIIENKPEEAKLWKTLLR